MATDLDRAYIINGDDLRIVLSSTTGLPFIVREPEDVTRYILGRIAKPAGEACFPTPTDLGRALAEFPVAVTENHVGGSKLYTGWLSNPDTVAKRALEALGTHDMQPAPRPAVSIDREVDAISRIYDTLIALDDADAVGRVLGYLTERCLGVKP